MKTSVLTFLRNKKKVFLTDFFNLVWSNDRGHTTIVPTYLSRFHISFFNPRPQIINASVGSETVKKLLTGNL